MIDRDHNFPVALGSNGHRDRAEIGDETLADVASFPAADPVLQLKSDAEREGAWKALQYALAPVSRDGIVTKILAIRFLLSWESDSMAKVASRYGVTRAAISKQANALADALQIPHLRSARARENYKQAQFKAWKKRKEKKHDGTH